MNCITCSHRKSEKCINFGSTHSHLGLFVAIAGVFFLQSFVVDYNFCVNCETMKWFCLCKAVSPGRYCAWLRLCRCFSAAWILFPMNTGFANPCIDSICASALGTKSLPASGLLYSATFFFWTIGLRNLFGSREKALVCFIVKFQLLCEWL